MGYLSYDRWFRQRNPFQRLDNVRFAGPNGRLTVKIARAVSDEVDTKEWGAVMAPPLALRSLSLTLKDLEGHPTDFARSIARIWLPLCCPVLIAFSDDTENRPGYESCLDNWSMLLAHRFLKSKNMTKGRLWEIMMSGDGDALRAFVEGTSTWRDNRRWVTGGNQKCGHRSLKTFLDTWSK